MVFEELAMGVNATRQHQRLIAELIYGLRKLFKQGNITLEPIPKAMLDEDRTSATPDVILVDANNEVKIIIEVTVSANSIKNDFKKIATLIDEYEYGIEEGFAYNHELHLWRKYQKNVGEIADRPSYSALLDYDLQTLL
jgi:hypothetical protein